MRHLGIFGVAILVALGARSEQPGPPGSASETPGTVVFSGTCDASGAVPVDERHFVDADDEDNVLRLYDAETGGPPLLETDVSRDARLLKERKHRMGRPDRPAKGGF